jgi:putative ABC transport system permease protein
VVSDVRYRGLQEVQMDVYDPALQVGRPADNIVVRTSGDPLVAAPAIRAIARQLDPTSIIDTVSTLDAVVGRAEAPWRLTTWMFVLFAGLAFALAALGLFGLVALDVAHRRREFAIRLALGSSSSALLRSVLIRAGWRVLLGLTAGLAVSFVAGRTLGSLLFDVAPADRVTYTIVLAVVLLVVTAAAHLPARRASNVDPQSVLRV